jgi:hypothetical protein
MLSVVVTATRCSGIVAHQFEVLKPQFNRSPFRPRLALCPDFYVGTRMLTSMLPRFGLPLLVLALAAPVWSTCQAGSFQTRPASPDAATRAGATPVLPATSWHKLSASALVGGCGKGFLRDPQTHRCRGPADIRGIAP